MSRKAADPMSDVGEAPGKSRRRSIVASVRGASVKPGPALALLVVLVALRAALLVPAAVDALLGDGAGDLAGRRAELEWVFHGVDPHLAIERLQWERGTAGRPSGDALLSGELSGESLRLEDLAVGEFADGDLGRVNAHLLPYPQWSYPLLAPFLWPPWPATRAYFLAISVASVLGFCWWASRLLDGPWRAAAALVCLLPAASWAVGIHVGQVSALLLLSLALLASALARQRALAAGLLLGWAALKPTTGLLFGFALLSPWLAGRVRWPWVLRAALPAVATVLGATALVWWRTGVDPLASAIRLAGAGTTILAEGWGLLPVLEAGMEARGAQPGTAATVVAVLAVVAVPVALWLTRSSSLLVQFAVIGVAARFWTYHRHYDDVLVLFLLLALLVELRRGSLLALGALVCVAMTVAAPTPASELMGLWRASVWVAATVILVLETRNAEHPLVRDPHSPASRLVDGRRLASRASMGVAGAEGSTPSRCRAPRR